MNQSRQRDSIHHAMPLPLWERMVGCCSTSDLSSFLLFTLKTSATLWWDGCCAWTSCSRKWRVEANISMVSSILFLSHSPKNSTRTKDNLTCIVCRMSIYATFCCSNYLLCFLLPLILLFTRSSIIVMCYLKWLEHKTLAYISQNYTFTVYVPAF